MNPCPCGYYGDPAHEYICGPSTIARYQKRISRPLLDRIDIHLDVPRVDYDKLTSDTPAEVREHFQLDEAVRSLLRAAMERMGLTARAFHRILKLARTIADLEGSPQIQTQHLVQAIQYRRRTLL